MPVNCHVPTFAGQIPQERDAEVMCVPEVEMSRAYLCRSGSLGKRCRGEDQCPGSLQEVLPGSTPGHLLEDQKAGLSGEKPVGLGLSSNPVPDEARWLGLCAPQHPLMGH